MAFTIGSVSALVIGIACTWLRMDRDRAMYPVVMIVIAFLYTLFAVMGGSAHALVQELAVGAVFIVLAIAGFKSSLWFVVVALAAHGVFDFLHPYLYDNPGVPAWWPVFCSAYDIVAAAYLAWLITTHKTSARSAP
jgi:hypothetical protein